MKHGQKHHFEMNKTRSSPWTGDLHLHVVEHVVKKPRHTSTSFFSISSSSNKRDTGYYSLSILEDELLKFAFFLFDIAEKNGLVPSTETTEIVGDPVVTPAIVEPKTEEPKPKKKRSKKKKKSIEIGDEVVSDGGNTYIFQGYDDDGWLILHDGHRQHFMNPSYKISPS